MKRIILTLIFAMVSILGINAQSASSMLDKALGSCVTVAVYQTEAYGKMTLGMRGTVSEDAYKAALDLSGAKGSGSGFVVKRNNKMYVITNAHVIESASTESGSIYVYSINQTKYEVKVVGGDNFYDIAVLEFVTTPGKEVTTIEFTKTEPNVGDKVFAIGNPLGNYPYTVTDGIISAKNRARGGLTGKFGFLQHTATIIWGNSGGPLVSEKGEVVGINSQIAFAQAPDGSQILQQQINFSLEPKICLKLIDDVLNNNGRVKRAYLGIEVSQSYKYESQYNYSTIDPYPIISGVIEGSPAAAYLSSKLGYVVKQVNGVDCRNVEEVLGEFEKIGINAKFTMTLVNSAGSTETVSLTAGELKKIELEAIATYAINKIPGVNVNNSYGQVAIDYSDPAKKGDTKQKQYKKQDGKFTQTRGEQADATYYILAAGIYNENNPNIWKTLTLSQLGAALRYSSLSGVFDYYLGNVNNPSADPQLFRQYLSGEQNIVKTTIYY